MSIHKLTDALPVISPGAETNALPNFHRRSFMSRSSNGLRRTIFATILVIVALLAALTPQAARAQTCTLVQPTDVTYPWNVSFACAPATQANGSAMATAASELPFTASYVAIQKQLPFYLFATPSAYEDYDWGSNADVPSAGPNDFGEVVRSTAGVPIAVAVFQQNADGKAPPSIGYATTQQLGHASDSNISYIMNGGVYLLPEALTSAASDFANQVTADWTALNKLTNCSTSGSGIFNNRLDSSGNYICTSGGSGGALSSTYVGKTNEQVLQAAWPAIYGSNADILAEELGVIASSNNFPNEDYYFQNNNFACSQAMESYINSQGALPTSATLNARAGVTCAAVVKTTSCTPAWQASNAANPPLYPSWGWIFNCSTATPNNGFAANSALNFQKLGGSTTYNALQKQLAGYGDYIYFFDDQATFDSVFTAAGVAIGNFNISSDNADTAPLNNVWYTIVRTSSSGAQNDQGVGSSYILSHELGHVIDFNTGQPSSTANYNLALQHDWLFLDYTTWVSKTNYTRKPPCTLQTETALPGPLVGVTDPSTGNLYCSGGALAADESRWANKNNSYVLLYAANEMTGEPPEEDYQDNTGTLGNNNNPEINAKAGWREYFAQSMAIMSANDVLGGASNISASNIPSLDLVVQNGYFSCTAGTGRTVGSVTQGKGWIYFVYNAQELDLVPSCSSSLPDGFSYMPVVNKPLP